MNTIPSPLRPVPSEAVPAGTSPVIPPAVSLVIPCWNEESHIANCLDSILENDSCDERVEILVVDAMSTDCTRTIVGQYQRKSSQIRMLDNPQKLIPIAMNIGLSHARGEVILKIDAHSAYPRNYISRCVESLAQFQADNAGGICRILPRNETPTAKAIALSLAHPFSSGNACVKVGAKAPRWADSAAFGCWRKDTLLQLGGWNEKLAGSSDMDLNVRLRLRGGRILLAPDIGVTYYADATLREFWRHNFADGVWATYVLKFRSKAWSWRHWVPMGFTATLLACLLLAFASRYFADLSAMIAGTYVMANLAASVQVALQKRALSCWPALPAAFAIRHFAHGLGALLGLALVLVPGEHWKGRRGKV